MAFAVGVAVLAGPARADDELGIPKTKRLRRVAPSSLPQDLKTSGDSPSQGGLGFVKPLTPESIAIPAEVAPVPSQDRKSTRLNSSHSRASRMPSSA